MEFLHFFYFRRKKIADSTKLKRKLNTIAYLLDYKSKTGTFDWYGLILLPFSIRHSQF
jgi:hypothetical protein